MATNKWDMIAEDYERRVGDKGDIYHRLYINPVLFRLLGQVKGRKILDLACGSGYISRILARKGAKVTGIDSSERLISIAEQREASGRLGINYLKLNAANMKGVRNGSFDCIVSAMALHDIKEVKGAVMECSRVLKNGGIFVFSIRHPVREVGDIKKDKTGYHIEIKDYSHIAKLNSPISKRVAITVYHRPLQYYFKILLDAGFVVSGFEEIAAAGYSHGISNKDKKLLKFKSSFPSFLVMECKKQMIEDGKRRAKNL
ncbi:MAG: class I SAM-dependent methyltransferase [Candidatus Marsarchaeota archaeon]|nr:class I SAM-dependent methyltransferase [Candidatus Marsarchaeota archaeon]